MCIQPSNGGTTLGADTTTVQGNNSDNIDSKNNAIVIGNITTSIASANSPQCHHLLPTNEFDQTKNHSVQNSNDFTATGITNNKYEEQHYYQQRKEEMKYLQRQLARIDKNGKKYEKRKKYIESKLKPLQREHSIHMHKMKQMQREILEKEEQLESMREELATAASEEDATPPKTKQSRTRKKKIYRSWQYRRGTGGSTRHSRRKTRCVSAKVQSEIRAYKFVHCCMTQCGKSCVYYPQMIMFIFSNI